MEGKDIEAYIQAKRETAYSYVFSVIAIALLTLLIFMEISESFQEYTIAVITIAMIFASAGGNLSRWVKVPRRRLLEIIERQINRDPEALRILAHKQASWHREER